MLPRRFGQVGWVVACFVPLTTVHAAPPRSDTRAEFERALAEFDQAQQIQLDRPDRARQLFRQAAQRFDSVMASGVVNGRLEFNLANCYLQAGDVGRAILHYRRAQRLIPGDEMLVDNLTTARSRCLTSIKPTRRSAFLKSVFFWHYQTSVEGRTRAALVLYIALWVLLIVRNFIRRRGVTVSAIACAVLAGAAAVSAGMTHWGDRNTPDGVVTAMDVVVYKGPGTGYQRQFEQPLQPGVEFTLRQQRGDWWRIELADGKTGWIEADRAQLIPPSGKRALQLSTQMPALDREASCRGAVRGATSTCKSAAGTGMIRTGCNRDRVPRGFEGRRSEETVCRPIKRDDFKDPGSRCVHCIATQRAAVV